ncbi:MAG: flavodoxin [Oscillospiraceae bacterium]|jgi:flavodoxin short chain|nr:flavodoxin [Oscillospiraceae bacterium]
MSKTAIIYWSGTGNTEAMAKAIESGMRSAGAEVELLSADKADAGSLDGFVKLAFGCPSMGNEELEDSVFAPFFASAEGKLGGKPVALFGSYGWGDGEWMRTWQERITKSGAILFEQGLIQQEAPDEAVCSEFGKRFAAV